MADAAYIPIRNCARGRTRFTVLENEMTQLRGDGGGIKNNICDTFAGNEDLPANKYKDRYIQLEIKVEKEYEEVEDPRDGITITCLESSCPFNKGKER